jgi:hypothetical protein
MEVSGKLQTPAALPRSKILWYKLVMRLGGSHSCLDAVANGKFHVISWIQEEVVMQ